MVLQDTIRSQQEQRGAGPNRTSYPDVPLDATADELTMDAEPRRAKRFACVCG